VRKHLLSILVVMLSWFTITSERAPAAFPSTLRVTTGAGAGNELKCDGSTDDTAALQAEVTSAGVSHVKVVIPGGTCLTNGNTITIPDGVSIQGAGKMSTTIKRKDSADAATNMFTLSGATGSVTISDLTIDYNKANQTLGSSTVGTRAVTVDHFTLQRTRIINSWNWALVFRYPAGTFPSNILIAENDFENNGTSDGTVVSDISNGDVSIAAPNGLRIRDNHAENTNGSFFVSGTGGNSEGFGNVVIQKNTLNGVLGFGVALGGGGPLEAGGRGSVIEENVFNMVTARAGLIDLAFWTETIVSKNVLFNGRTAGIADAPPANKVSVTNNTITGNGQANSNCIVLGGSEVVISGNTCSGSGGAGIAITVGKTSQSHDVVISNNEVKNSSQSSPGIRPGIALFLAPGGTAALSNVTIKGNRSYDDQRTPTQGWGIGIGLAGQRSGFSDITIENNDMHGNKTGPLLNNAHTRIRTCASC
jgi:Right handed beta helix region